MNKKYFLIFRNCVLILFILFFSKISFAQTGVPSESNDAIAVRVVPNPNHYSISRWYESQGFKGSPQALVVDGYEAIRDGRTVYVNAAQVSPDPKSIFTNIYLISYNQDSNIKTVDVLGQLVSHWKFNDNIVKDPQATCSISGLACDSDQDCSKEQSCSLINKVCLLKNTKKCLVDSDCPTNFFCDSLKAKVIRDIKRVGRLEELKESLLKYNNLNQHYPVLSAGTYLPYTSVSVWPSWNKSFLPELTIKQNFIDPINKLGACPAYDKQTCWDESTKRFVYDPNTEYLTLPASSYAFVYRSNQNGSNYSLCAVMESRDSRNSLLGYHFSPNDPVTNQCVVATGILTDAEIVNTAPKLLNKSLSGESGREFVGFVNAVDEQNDPLIWKLEPITTNWSSWKPGAPILENTSSLNNKKIYALSAGEPGIYQMKLTVSDDKGGTLVEILPIVITNKAPFIGVEDVNYLLDPIIPLDFSFYLADSNIGDVINNDNGLVYKIIEQKIPDSSMPANLINLDIFAWLTKTITIDGVNLFKINFKGLIPTTYKFLNSIPFIYRIEAVDKYGLKTKSDFAINIKVDKPILNFDCLNKVRLGRSYSCLLGSNTQGNHSINYLSAGSLPSGITISEANNFFTLSGTPNAKNAASYNIKIQALNEYGTINQKEFNLKVNTYCGDGIKQEPNSENRGGFYNDGYEDCDGKDGVASSASESSSVKQYLCTTEGNTPEQIFGSNYCVFESAENGGGFCGDGYCSIEFENKQNCFKDCDPNCQPECSGKICGSDGCSGTCGYCDGVCDSYGQVCEPSCKADCNGKVCGPDGCGGACGSCDGNCSSDGKICTPICVPKCENKECGSNGCPDNGVCGNCQEGSSCDSTGKCVVIKCLSNSSCNDNKICTDDICNNPGTLNSSCSYLSNSYTQECFNRFGDCTIGGLEKCKSGVLGVCDAIDPRLASCSNKECGDDGCGANCGTCSNGKACSDGKCSTVLCSLDSQCNDDNPCTDDICQNPGTASSVCKHINNSFVDTTCSVSYGSCGFIGERTCKNGKFGTCSTTNPNMTCGSQKCGENSCGVNCGTCASGFSCSAGLCVNACMNGVFDEGEECETIFSGYVGTLQWKNGVRPTCSSVTNGVRPYGTVNCNNYNCKSDISSCKEHATCGDGRIEENEECDFDVSSYITNPGFPAPAIYKQGYATCAQINIQKPVGSLICSASTCKVISSGCSAQPECFNDKDCNTGYYCQLNNSSFFNCNSSAGLSTCQKKCWPFLETTRSTQYQTGDNTRAASITDCSFIKVDDPTCGIDNGCPYYCNNKRTFIGYTGDDNTCKKSNCPLFSSCRDPREIYKCERLDYITRFYLDSCRASSGNTSVNGNVSADGICKRLNYCGDFVCDNGENCSNCVNDCGFCASVCSDNTDCLNGVCLGAMAYCAGACPEANDKLECEVCGGFWGVDIYGECIY